MKKICFLFLLSVGLVLSSCKNYDDRFDALNGQITALQGQVTGLATLQTEVTALKSTIAAIQSSLTGLQSNISTVQSDFNTALGKAKTDINQQIEDQLNTGLSGLSDKNAELNASLTELTTKLTELETKLQGIQDGTPTKDEVTAVQTALADQLKALQESLQESLKKSDFHTGDLNLTSSGGLAFVTTQLQEITQINGDVTINTDGWSDEQKTSLQTWVAKITLIFGDLDITHADTEADKVIKFAALTGVNKLEDKQPHAHYPELTSASEVTFATDGAANVETVRLPKLTTTKFTDATIHLKKGKELHLNTFSEHAGSLSITLDGSGITNLNALKQLTGAATAEKTLQLVGFRTVGLPELTTLKKLHIQDVTDLTAPKVKGAELQISKDVSSVDIGTADGGAVTGLTIDTGEAQRDLEELKIGGDKGLAVVLPSGIEVAHIHGAKSVIASGTDDLDTFVTAREIKALHLEGTDIETLALGHTSGSGGTLKLINNASLESLTADSVNNLKFLTIQGNTRLESVSFEGLDTAASDAEVTIGARAATKGNPFTDGHQNRLIASKIHIEVKSGAGKQAGSIVDASGLSDLKAFLGSSNIKTAVVHYDGTAELKVSKTADAEDDVDISEANSKHFLLFRKGVKDGGDGAIQAKRVFARLINDASTPGSITIGAAGAYKTIELAVGGTPHNWAEQINAPEVKNFFDANDVLIEAKAGGWSPEGTIQTSLISSYGTDATSITQAQIDALGDEAYIQLGIGGTKAKPDYSHRVYITLPESGDEDDLPAQEKFGGENETDKNKKHAVSHEILVAESTETDAVTAKAIFDELFDDFPGQRDFSGETRYAGRDFSINPTVVPYYVGNPSYDSFAVGLYDRQPISKPIPVHFTHGNSNGKNDIAKELLAIGFQRFTVANIDNRFKDRGFVITLTSKTPGKEASTIGQPQNASSLATTPDGSDNLSPDVRTGSKAWLKLTPDADRATGAELPIKGDEANPTYPYWSSAPQEGKNSVKVTTGTEDTTDRLGWLP